MRFQPLVQPKGRNGRLQAVVAALGIVLGFVYVAAGVGKALDLDRFVATIVDITRISSLSATYLAIALIVSEVAGGIFLMLRRTARPAAFALLFMTALFMWVLLSAILKGRPIECNCFGILNIGFPNHIELTIDAVLFNVLGLLGLYYGGGNNPTDDIGRRFRVRWWHVAMAGLIFYMEGEMLVLAYSRVDTGVDNKALKPIVEYARHRDEQVGEQPGQRFLLFLLDFADFSCPPCFNDFIALCDSIQRGRDPALKVQVTGLMRPGPAFDAQDQERLDEWAQMSDLRFRIFMAPESLFVQSDFRRSCVLVVESAGLIVERGEFPLGAEIRYKVLEASR